MSMMPSPIMPRSLRRSVVGTSQSSTWKACSRSALARSMPAKRSGSRPPRDRRRARPRADRCAVLRIQAVAEVERLAQRVNRRRDRPRRSDAAARWRASRLAAAHARGARRCRPRPRCVPPRCPSRVRCQASRNCGRPPTTSTRQGGVRGAFASSTGTAVVVAHLRGDGPASAGNMPPRQ